MSMTNTTVEDHGPTSECEMTLNVIINLCASLYKLTENDWFIWISKSMAWCHWLPWVPFLDHIGDPREDVFAYTFSEPTLGPYMLYQKIKHLVVAKDTEINGLTRRATCALVGLAPTYAYRPK